jgi:hypothetical protein
MRIDILNDHLAVKSDQLNEICRWLLGHRTTGKKSVSEMLVAESFTCESGRLELTE